MSRLCVDHRHVSSSGGSVVKAREKQARAYIKDIVDTYPPGRGNAVHVRVLAAGLLAGLRECKSEQRAWGPVTRTCDAIRDAILEAMETAYGK